VVAVDIVVVAVDNYYDFVVAVAAVDSGFADRHLDLFDIPSVDIG
jgi:hypothetical protein